MEVKQQQNQKLTGTDTYSQHSKAVDLYWDSDFSAGNLLQLQDTIKAARP